jgi:hypothetical protein
MTIRDESGVIGFGLATMGIAFAGTMAAIFTLPPTGFYEGLPLVGAVLYLGLVPAGFVALFTLFLSRIHNAWAHPVPVTLAAFVGGALGLPLFYPLGFLSIEFLAALLVYPAYVIATFVEHRAALAGKELGLHVVVALGLYSAFAMPLLAIGFRWVDTTGCEECGATESLFSVVFLFALAFSVVIGALFRFRPSSRRARTSPYREAALLEGPGDGIL